IDVLVKVLVPAPWRKTSILCLTTPSHTGGFSDTDTSGKPSPSKSASTMFRACAVLPANPNELKSENVPLPFPDATSPKFCPRRRAPIGPEVLRERRIAPRDIEGPRCIAEQDRHGAADVVFALGPVGEVEEAVSVEIGHHGSDPLHEIRICARRRLRRRSHPV